jgi:hypothetical protein
MRWQPEQTETPSRGTSSKVSCLGIESLVLSEVNSFFLFPFFLRPIKPKNSKNKSKIRKPPLELKIRKLVPKMFNKVSSKITEEISRNLDEIEFYHSELENAISKIKK